MFVSLSDPNMLLHYATYTFIADKLHGILLGALIDVHDDALDIHAAHVAAFNTLAYTDACLQRDLWGGRGKLLVTLKI